MKLKTNGSINGDELGSQKIHRIMSNFSRLLSVVKSLDNMFS